MDRQQEFVLRTLEERDIRFIRLWFTDVLGTLKSVAVAPAELESAFEEGIGFDGSAIGLLSIHMQSSLMFVTPSRIAPAFLRRATAVASDVPITSRRAQRPDVFGIPTARSASFVVNGMP